MFKKLILICLLLTFPLTSLARTKVEKDKIKLEIKKLGSDEEVVQANADQDITDKTKFIYKKDQLYSKVCETEYKKFEKTASTESTESSESSDTEPPAFNKENHQENITLCECNKFYKKMPDSVPKEFKNFCNTYITKSSGYCIYDKKDFEKFGYKTTSTTTGIKDQKNDLSKILDFKEQLSLYSQDCTITNTAACSILAKQAGPICASDPLSTITLTGLTGDNSIKCNSQDPRKIRCDTTGKLKIFEVQDVFDSERFNTNYLKAPGQGNRFTKSQEQTGTIVTVINAVIDFLVRIASTVALVIFIIGCVFLITSTGNTEQIEKGYAMIKYSIVGLLVVLLSYFAVITVQSFLF